MVSCLWYPLPGSPVVWAVGWALVSFFCVLLLAFFCAAGVFFGDVFAQEAHVCVTMYKVAHTLDVTHALAPVAPVCCLFVPCQVTRGASGWTVGLPQDSMGV